MKWGGGMANINELARDAILLGVAGTVNKSNGRKVRTGLQKQYFRDETLIYTEQVGELASNVYETEIQGVDLEDWYRYVPVKIRVDNAVQVSSGELMTDDWMKIYIIQPTGIDTIGQGAYLFFDNNWWMVYKPKGVYTVRGMALVRRCNTVINKLDFYGNIVSIPMSFNKLGTLGNAPAVSENMILSKNYMNCFCQLNDITKEFTENTRMIQGKAAYAIRGINDFTREYTDDPDSVHIMAFTIERQEPLEQDSIELQVADYYSFSWNISIIAQDHMVTGFPQQIQCISYRNEVEVNDSEEHPVSYLYESSDTRILTISPEGEIIPLRAGNAAVKVTLAQNEKITQTMEVEVVEVGDSKAIFTCTPVSVLDEFDSCIITAAYLQYGLKTDEDVEFTFSGPAKNAYKATKIGKNQYEIKCYNASKVPLTVTVSAHDTSDTMVISLYP